MPPWTNKINKSLVMLFTDKFRWAFAGEGNCFNNDCNYMEMTKLDNDNVCYAKNSDNYAVNG